MKAKTLFIIPTLIAILSMLSFRSSIELHKPINTFLIDEDGNCGINFVIVNANCTVTVSGSVTCDGAMYQQINSFQGTITFSGNCPNGKVNVGYAVPDGNGGWNLPTGAAIAFYKTGSENDCEATDVEFIGTSDANVSLLNSISQAFLSELQKDIGC